MKPFLRLRGDVHANDTRDAMCCCCIVGDYLPRLKWRDFEGTTKVWLEACMNGIVYWWPYANTFETSSLPIRPA